MSPKTATTISFTLLCLILTTTLSSATANRPDHNGCPGDSVPEVLQHYGIPASLFPDYVQEFSCEPIEHDNTALRLQIQLKGSCKVTREFGLKNMLAFQPEISAIISRHELTDVKGVTLMLFFGDQQVGERMTISAVRIMEDPIFYKTLQFFSREGVNSPKFPIMCFSNKPPTCDHHSDATAAFGYSTGVVFPNNNDENVPKWVYKYGRLLPFVAA